MHVRHNDLLAGLQRVNGVLNWRGVPENHPIREHARHFHEIVADLDRGFRDAARQQVDALDAAHDCVSASMPDLLRTQATDDLLALEAQILKALMDAATLQMNVWSRLRTSIDGCSSKLTGPGTKRTAAGKSNRDSKRRA